MAKSKERSPAEKAQTESSLTRFAAGLAWLVTLAVFSVSVSAVSIYGAQFVDNKKGQWTFRQERLTLDNLIGATLAAAGAAISLATFILLFPAPGSGRRGDVVMVTSRRTVDVLCKIWIGLTVSPFLFQLWGIWRRNEVPDQFDTILWLAICEGTFLRMLSNSIDAFVKSQHELAQQGADGLVHVGSTSSPENIEMQYPSEEPPKPGSSDIESEGTTKAATGDPESQKTTPRQPLPDLSAGIVRCYLILHWLFAFPTLGLAATVLHAHRTRTDPVPDGLLMPIVLPSLATTSLIFAVLSVLLDPLASLLYEEQNSPNRVLHRVVMNWVRLSKTMSTYVALMLALVNRGTLVCSAEKLPMTPSCGTQVAFQVFVWLDIAILVFAEMYM